MKKLLWAIFMVGLILILIVAWLLLGSGTAFDDKSKYLYVGTGKTDKVIVMDSIVDNNLLSHPIVFSLLANQMSVWEKLKPGRYKITKGESLLGVARMLRNNQQSPVNLVINKLRTKQDLAKLIGKNFEADSADVMSFLNNPDSLSSLHVDANSVMAIVIPNTYTFYWTASVSKIFNKLKSESETFWSKNNRTAKAAEMGFTPAQVYTIASIVEEETNKNDEKGEIASVYINRYNKGMPLGADPTVKFALQDFSIKRIMFKHLEVLSPYNTYKVRGLPPGPICTPSARTIDEVLDAPKTDYLFFVAKSDFSGYHTFSSNFAEHKKYAREYQTALDEYLARKKAGR